MQSSECESGTKNTKPFSRNWRHHKLKQIFGSLLDRPSRRAGMYRKVEIFQTHYLGNYPQGSSFMHLPAEQNSFTVMTPRDTPCWHAHEPAAEPITFKSD